ncbi:Gep7p PWA37_002164 [Arxiozyma heterogenica]|uniref:Genetic interactor of prohibitin 7, mitochondrial n=1 Tax=Arxiozyma heterogenica TaxID=278026 RepID=A0AAN7WQ51_9SACH|nr:hypothetical protein RI543_001627 [Kazachstania heterogenica]
MQYSMYPWKKLKSSNYRYILKRFISSSSETKKYIKGEVPKSLLIKQEQRLKNNSNKSLKDGNSLSFAISDVFNLFNPNAVNKEDESLSNKEYEDQLFEFINSSKFKNLLKNKFQFENTSNTVNFSSMISKFKTLAPVEYDAIHKFVIDTDMCSRDWKTLPIYIKQLQYFMAYGPLGPRSDTKFDESPFLSTKPKKDILSSTILSAFILLSSIGFIKHSFQDTKKIEITQ